MPCLSHYRLTDKVVLWNSAALRRKLRDRHARDHNTIGIYGYHLRLLGKSSQRTCVRASLSKFDCFIICLILVYIFLNGCTNLFTLGDDLDSWQYLGPIQRLFFCQFLLIKISLLASANAVSQHHDHILT